MTIKEIRSLPHGTKVLWDGKDHGYVVNLLSSKKRHEPPLVYVEWQDGQRTDGSDDWALEHVTRA